MPWFVLICCKALCDVNLMPRMWFSSPWLQQHLCYSHDFESAERIQIERMKGSLSACLCKISLDANIESFCPPRPSWRNLRFGGSSGSDRSGLRRFCEGKQPPELERSPVAPRLSLSLLQIFKADIKAMFEPFSPDVFLRSGQTQAGSFSSHVFPLPCRCLVVSPARPCWPSASLQGSVLDQNRQRDLGWWWFCHAKESHY